MTPIALILGGGPRIGLSVANKLVSTGYQVALGSRNPPTAPSSSIHPIPVDVSDPDSVAAAFARVNRELGIPAVVVYNAAALSFPSNPGDPIGSIAPDVLERDWRVNALGGYAALRAAVEGFRALKNEGEGGDADGVFIATGNVTPLQPMPMALTLGAGKAMLVHLVQLAVESCKDEGFRFYFPSQVSESGGPVSQPQVSAEAHANVYWDLIRRQSQGSWDVRFLADGTEVQGN
ncbi:hypothetical protein PHISP_01158 [Aspergillus sp. HF37]|nr:hypothetical protein PHISP_01158 [Aspergillus sp. HF37]